MVSKLSDAGRARTSILFRQEPGSLVLVPYLAAIVPPRAGSYETIRR